MKTQESFYLTKLRCEIAMQQALLEWQPVKLDSQQDCELKCPRCQSTNIGTRGRAENGRQRYNCWGCRRSFTEQPKVEWHCNCLTPGSIPKCQDCPDFHPFLQLVKLKAETLRSLSEQELQQLLT
jgi:hypothetical protein